MKVREHGGQVRRATGDDGTYDREEGRGRAREWTLLARLRGRIRMGKRSKSLRKGKNEWKGGKDIEREKRSKRRKKNSSKRRGEQGKAVRKKQEKEKEEKNKMGEGERGTG